MPWVFDPPLSDYFVFNIMDERIRIALKEAMRRGRKISFLVGAGISAASGIPTFRSGDGFWVVGSKHYTPEEMGTYRMFTVAAREVWKFMLYRMSIGAFAQPNKSHFMLRDIEALLQDNFALISQNVDGLHRKAGSSEARTYSIHGDLGWVRCGDACSDELYPFPKSIKLENRRRDDLTETEWEILKCPQCGSDLRPHVLWFDECYNEKFYKRNSVLKISEETDVLFILGTSGATNMPQVVTENVLSHGGLVVEVNIAETLFSYLLEKESDAIVLRQDCGDFLGLLKQEIEQLM